MNFVIDLKIMNEGVEDLGIIFCNIKFNIGDVGDKDIRKSAITHLADGACYIEYLVE